MEQKKKKEELVKLLRDEISELVPNSVFEHFLGAIISSTENVDATFSVNDAEQNGIKTITVKYGSKTEHRNYTITIDNNGSYFILSSVEKKYACQKNGDEPKEEDLKQQKEETVTLRFGGSINSNQGWILESTTKTTDVVKNRRGLHKYLMTDTLVKLQTYYNEYGVASQELCDTHTYMSRTGDTVNFAPVGTEDLKRFSIKARTGFSTCQITTTTYQREYQGRVSTSYAIIDPIYDMGSMRHLINTNAQGYTTKVAEAKQYTQEKVLTALANTPEPTRTSLLSGYFPEYYTPTPSEKILARIQNQ